MTHNFNSPSGCSFLPQRLCSAYNEASEQRLKLEEVECRLVESTSEVRSLQQHLYKAREDVGKSESEEESVVRNEQALRSKVVALESQLAQLQAEQAASTPGQLSADIRRHVRHNSQTPGQYALSHNPREDNEGVDTDVESVSSSSIAPPSLDILLNSSVDKTEDAAPWREDFSLSETMRRLAEAERRTDHVNQLLRETEASTVLLTEQNKVLKSELRRLERNEERLCAGENLEYLKNVLMRFFVLAPGSDRCALIPVLHKLLHLSSEERTRLTTVASGTDEGGLAGGTWVSYLSSWTGLH
uniref:GRIP domain-containing protein n=1 Tax=Eptatretus burgeri TaxID=7764 RepID=A0A8C4PZQ4_EPTBU